MNCVPASPRDAHIFIPVTSCGNRVSEDMVEMRSCWRACMQAQGNFIPLLKFFEILKFEKEVKFERHRTR